MSPLPRLSSLLRNFLRKNRVERELDAELSSYLDALAEEKMAAGQSTEQARREARLELGGREQVKEHVRAVRTGAWLEQLLQDVRFGLRQLRRSPGFTLAVTLTLALGIGTSTAIFTLAHALFLRLAPVPNAGRIVHVSQTIESRKDGLSFPLSFADYRFFREHSQSFTELAAHYSGSPMHLMQDGEPSSIFGAVVTRNYFAALGVEPAHGRFFRPDEDEIPGRDPVAVIAYGLWDRRFARDPHVLGKPIHLNGVAFTVIGVAPRSFESDRSGQVTLSVWIPSAMFKVGYRYCNAFERGCAIVALTGLLKPGVTAREAQSELSLLSRQLEVSYPDTNKGRGVFVVPARGVAPDRQAESGRTVGLLGGSVAVVLAISCANVAGLLFGRGLRRRREVAVRLALGARRGRLVRQFLTESMLLGLLGGAAGLLVASWAKHLLVAFYGVTYSGFRLSFNLGLDATVLTFTIGLSLLTGLTFGVIPALQSSRVDLVSSINASGSGGGTRPSRVRDGLVIVQVALSIVLLVGAGLLMRSLQNVRRGPGFDPGRIALLRLRPSLIDYDVTKAWAFQQEVNRRLDALPGVEAVSSSTYPPLPGWGNDESVWLPGHEPADRSLASRASANRVGAQYFETLGLPILEGRAFIDRDDHSGPRGVIVNRTLASQLWPDESAVGRMLVVSGVACQVIGVAHDAQYRDITEHPKPHLYLSYWQQDRAHAFNGDSQTHVRVAGDPAAMLPLLRRTIAAVDPNVPISEDLLLAERLDYHFRYLRAVSTMLVTLGSLAIFLSAIALYAVLASAVRQRTREIAIRMALGARQAAVSRMVIRQGLSLCAVGAGIGLLAALTVTRALQNLLYGVSSVDPATFVAVTCLLAAVTTLACYLPARRAARIQPMDALRRE